MIGRLADALLPFLVMGLGAWLFLRAIGIV